MNVNDRLKVKIGFWVFHTRAGPSPDVTSPLQQEDFLVCMSSLFYGGPGMPALVKVEVHAKACPAAAS